CKKIAENKHADIQVIEMPKASEGESTKTRVSVEQVNEILHAVNLPPFEGKCKVFIFDGFENLSIAAANRMLKTLEEPVSNVVFVLLAENEKLVPVTIISRCQRLELFPISFEQEERVLVERWKVEPQKAKLLARLSAGRLGWAVAMSLDDSLLQQRNEWLDTWLEIIDSDLDTRFVFAAKTVDKFSQNRETVLQKLDMLRDWWRDVLLVKAGNAAAVTNVDREAELKEMSARYSLVKIRHFLHDVQAASEQLKKNINPQLVMEVLMLNMPERGKVKEGKSLT
ncbi:MAG TPA: DNA polymerase III subunit delta' C-terminal domain-containing protein, partial [Dehalococcoidales bacterium]|nr:DNA polymerase III subunit delta' C-terminal domain-containing protein [Dehalococcoidales bacterium]